MIAIVMIHYKTVSLLQDTTESAVSSTCSYLFFQGSFNMISHMLLLCEFFLSRDTTWTLTHPREKTSLSPTN